jgi:hypothetical protein
VEPEPAPAKVKKSKKSKVEADATPMELEKAQKKKRKRETEAAPAAAAEAVPNKKQKTEKSVKNISSDPVDVVPTVRLAFDNVIPILHFTLRFCLKSTTMLSTASLCMFVLFKFGVVFVCNL